MVVAHRPVVFLGRLSGRRELGQRKPEGFRNAFAISGAGFEEVLNLRVARYAPQCPSFHVTRDVTE